MNAEINQRVQVGDLTPSGEIHYLFSSSQCVDYPPGRARVLAVLDVLLPLYRQLS